MRLADGSLQYRCRRIWRCWPLPETEYSVCFVMSLMPNMFGCIEYGNKQRVFDRSVGLRLPPLRSALSSPCSRRRSPCEKQAPWFDDLAQPDERSASFYLDGIALAGDGQVH